MEKQLSVYTPSNTNDIKCVFYHHLLMFIFIPLNLLLCSLGFSVLVVGSRSLWEVSEGFSPTAMSRLKLMSHRCEKTDISISYRLYSKRGVKSWAVWCFVEDWGGSALDICCVDVAVHREIFGLWRPRLDCVTNLHKADKKCRCWIVRHFVLS